MWERMEKDPGKIELTGKRNEAKLQANEATVDQWRETVKRQWNNGIDGQREWNGSGGLSTDYFLWVV